MNEACPTRAQLAWLCRRGCLELDLLLRRYLDVAYATASDEEKRQFFALLQEEDAVLWRWLIDAQPVSVERYAELVAKIRTLTDAAPQTLA